eukprot:g53817.t1
MSTAPVALPGAKTALKYTAIAVVVGVAVVFMQHRINRLRLKESEELARQVGQAALEDEAEADAGAASEADPSSYSNFWEVVTESLHLDLRVDFSARVLAGSVELLLARTDSKVSSVILDTRDLTISAVQLLPSLQPLAFTLQPKDATFGSALVIWLPQDGALKHRIRVTYTTSPESMAVQWLPKEQTAGKQHPFLFTQCQAIHARALLPCQDSPAVKLTYTARVLAPRPLTALMSAQQQEGVEGKQDEQQIPDGYRAFYFQQPVKMPSYLIALAVGNLKFRPISKRCGVWSEPETVDAGASEFSQTEDFLRTAEAICGPYEWAEVKGRGLGDPHERLRGRYRGARDSAGGRYDILLLPPSFPYGGMENPCLTFVTPTLIAGDKSLAGVVAHEIAHSWMGNLVTTRTWEDFWLNEGFTVYVERKIARALEGEPMMHLQSMIGWKALEGAVEHFGAEHPFTALRPSLAGLDPDDAFSTVPYEKGYNLLWYLEGLMGGHDAMLTYIKAHVREFKGRTITSEQFMLFFAKFWMERGKQEQLTKIDWDLWLHGRGLPPKPVWDTSLSDDATRLADLLVQNEGQQPRDGKQANLDFRKWKTPQVLVFLERLEELLDTAFQALLDKEENKSRLQASVSSTPTKQPGAAQPHTNLPDDEWVLLAPTRTRFSLLFHRVDMQYGLLKSRNAEVRFRWLKLCVKARMVETYSAVSAFLVEQGRMKFVRPLYRLLFAAGQKGRAEALRTFKEHKQGYHSVAQKMIARDLGLAE